MEQPSKIGFKRKILAFGRSTEQDFARALLIDPDGKSEAIKVNFNFPRKVFIHVTENIIMYQGQLIVYQTSLGISKLF